MKVLLIKSCRDELFLKIYFYLTKRFGAVDVLIKKGSLLNFEFPSKFEYDFSELSKSNLNSHLTNLKIQKFEKVYFIVPDSVSNLAAYKNVYSFVSHLDTKNILFIDACLIEKPLRSWVHFYRLIYFFRFFKVILKIILFSVCFYSKILKKLKPKFIVEKQRL